jgi:DNA-binding transcriptional ArsR family regulator
VGAAARAPRFAALGDATRLRLLAQLAAGTPRSISELSAGTPVTRQAITKHLRVLEAAGLVRSHTRGRRTLFTLEPKPLEELSGFLANVSRRWDERLVRLKALVET